MQKQINLNSVWNQQERFFKAKDRITSPDVQMIYQEQVCEFISNIMEQGHKVVLGMDVNKSTIQDKTLKSKSNHKKKKMIKRKT